MIDSLAVLISIFGFFYLLRMTERQWRRDQFEAEKDRQLVAEAAPHAAAENGLQ